MSYETTTPKELIPALRQFRHTVSEGLVFGYDREVVDTLVEQLQRENEEFRKTIVACPVLDYAEKIEELEQENERLRKTLVSMSVQSSTVQVMRILAAWVDEQQPREVS